MVKYNEIYSEIVPLNIDELLYLQTNLLQSFHSQIEPNPEHCWPDKNMAANLLTNQETN